MHLIANIPIAEVIRQFIEEDEGDPIKVLQALADSMHKVEEDLGRYKDYMAAEAWKEAAGQVQRLALEIALPQDTVEEEAQDLDWEDTK